MLLIFYLATFRCAREETVDDPQNRKTDLSDLQWIGTTQAIPHLLIPFFHCFFGMKELPVYLYQIPYSLLNYEKFRYKMHPFRILKAFVFLLIFYFLFRIFVYSVFFEKAVQVVV